MEAPDKIWINPPIDLPKLNGIIDRDSIQYVRKDAFIKKACEWLKDNITYTHPRKGTKECIVNLTIFKDYMKGE